MLMPDSPALGEFRADFGGLLGTIEERPTDDGPGFAGADKIIGDRGAVRAAGAASRTSGSTPARTWPRGWWISCSATGTGTRTSGAGRGWAKADTHSVDADPARPRPGLRRASTACCSSLARLSAPQLVEFSARIPAWWASPGTRGCVDRRLLSGLDWPVWDTLATEPQGRLTDGVIDDAVRQLPPELQQRERGLARGGAQAPPRRAARGSPQVLRAARARGRGHGQRQGRAGRGRSSAATALLDLTISPAKGDAAPHLSPPLRSRRHPRSPALSPRRTTMPS